MVKEYLKKTIYGKLTGEKRLMLNNEVPATEYLHGKFQSINELGIYIHIPFCRSICPYCPYNKELFNDDLVKKYTDALLKEIEYYARIAGNRKVTTFYIGGGTPTTMLYKGIEKIIEQVYKSFNLCCSVHMESHPNDLNTPNLRHIKSLGVKYLSIGVESLQDRHLQTLKRPYNSRSVKQAVGRSVEAGFDCVNTDFIFALPGQTCLEVEEAGHELVKLGIHQSATYPLFSFPYTGLGSETIIKKPGLALMLKRRRMLNILEDIFYGSDFERSSVWAFTKGGTDKYCSVTVPLYIGLGVSGGSYLNEIFYLNTFNVSEYISSIEDNRMPVALSVRLSRKMLMAGWLYWRIYETRFRKSDFLKRFGVEFDSVYGWLIRSFSRMGLLRTDGDEIILNDRGSYWLHAFEDFFSIDFIGNLWGNSKNIPWPEKAVLIRG
jgi:oxygen-independent coproporphyrinogen-3 oxidase